MPQKRPPGPVLVANPPPDAPKVALILAAEVIFARDGIETASLREIAALAGQRNHHAVQYHFGTRDALIQAVFDYRMGQMEAARGTMLAAAEADGKLGDLRRIVEIIFIPQIELIDAYGDHSYAAFLSAYLLRYQASRVGQFVGNRTAANLDRTLGFLRQCLGQLPEAAAQRRLVTVCFMFLNILVIHIRGNRDDTERFDTAVEDTMRQIVAALSAPFAEEASACLAREAP